MRSNGPNILRWISLALLLAAVALFFYALVAYSRERSRLPHELTIAGVPDAGGPLDCPNGYAEVNDKYCIETDRNLAGSTIWTTANSACIAANVRLCSAGEWVHACENAASLGLSNLPGGLEWLGDLSSGGNANRLGQAVSSASCTAGSASSITLTNSNFRCCFER